MTRIRHFITVLSALLCVLGCGSVALAQAGHINWGPWDFDWEVKDGAGLAIRNVKFKNEEILYKASLPVIRVKYDSSCGPYADRINDYNLVPNPGCGSAKVCQQTYSAGGRDWLELGVLAAIGQYRIYDVWYLSNDGWINPAVWSRGLQCLINHTHHPYWRMDFDINGFPNDQVFVYDNNRGNEGWGPGWHKYTNEQEDVKNAPTSRSWFFRDNPTGHGVGIIPGGNDGSSDSFSAIDVAARLYHYNEDEPWLFNTAELGYGNGEDIQEKDDVFWYIAHLHHLAADGPSVWHEAGPWLYISR